MSIFTFRAILAVHYFAPGTTDFTSYTASIHMGVVALTVQNRQSLRASQTTSIGSKKPSTSTATTWRDKHPVMKRIYKNDI